MKLNSIAAAAITAFSTFSTHAAPAPDPLQIKLSVDVTEPAAEPQRVLLVFVGNQPARYGNFYSINATLDGSPFKTESKLPIWWVTQYYYGNCTLQTEDGRTVTLINYGVTIPNQQYFDPLTVFVGGKCSAPSTGRSITVDEL